MKEKIIEVYSYDELNKKAKETALNWYRNKNDMPFLNDDLIEYLKELLEENKIIYDDSLKVYYSLCYSQGDGFCFIGDFQTKTAKFKITHNSRYCHKKSTTIDLIELYDKTEQRFRDILDLSGEKDKEIEEELNSFTHLYYLICDNCEKLGYEEIESENQEAYIKEIFNDNGYTFRENGVIEDIEN